MVGEEAGHDLPQPLPLLGDRLVPPPTSPLQPVPCTGELTVAENGVDVLLTLVLRFGTNEALDACLRMLGAVGRIKRIAAP
jgi:hypothetical protein